MRSRILFVLAAIVLATPAYAQKQIVTLPGGRGGGMLSAATRIGDLVFVSGQTPARTDSTMDAQTTTELTKIKNILEAAGTTMENVVKCQVFITDGAEFAKMNEAYAKFFPADKGPPARTTVVVAALVSAGAKVEIECIAAMPK
ncbi:MAG TPA: RidA family protein, partial [Gemmatimonadaceae bacterium]|nr:RidA family protein [Gemmatimonadaceae bacterium]